MCCAHDVGTVLAASATADGARQSVAETAVKQLSAVASDIISRPPICINQYRRRVNETFGDSSSNNNDHDDVV